MGVWGVQVAAGSLEQHQRARACGGTGPGGAVLGAGRGPSLWMWDVQPLPRPAPGPAPENRCMGSSWTTGRCPTWQRGASIWGVDRTSMFSEARQVTQRWLNVSMPHPGTPWFRAAGGDGGAQGDGTRGAAAAEDQAAALPRGLRGGAVHLAQGRLGAGLPRQRRARGDAGALHGGACAVARVDAHVRWRR